MPKTSPETPVAGDLIRLCTGRYQDVFKLRASEIDFPALLHALAILPRWMGHSQVRISLAQHVLWVYRYVKRHGGSLIEQLAALVHDFPEGYTNDCSTPIKRRLPDYQALEEHVHEQLSLRLGTPYPYPDLVKTADWEVLLYEWHRFVVRRPWWGARVAYHLYELTAERRLRRTFYRLVRQLAAERGVDPAVYLTTDPVHPHPAVQRPTPSLTPSVA